MSYGAGAAAKTNGSVTITAWVSAPTTLTLSPASQTRTAGQTATVTAQVLDQDGDPMSGVKVDFLREGANSGSDSATTNSAGNATHTWTGANGPQDVVTASVVGTTAVGTATVAWRIPAALTVTADPEVATVGDQASATAHVLDQFGDPLGGVTVSFEREGANSGSGSATTNSAGNATHTWTGTSAGVDEVTATAGTAAAGAAAVAWQPAPTTTTTTSSSTTTTSTTTSSTTTSSTTTTTTPPPGGGSNVGAGGFTGSVAFDPPGLPPILAPCAPTTFSFDGEAEAFVLNTTIVGYAGPVTFEGGGSSDCENATGGSGSLTLSAEGEGPTGSTIVCESLTGDFSRFLVRAQINLTGDCTINGISTTGILFTADVLVAADGAAGITDPVTLAHFAGDFAVSPG